MFALARYAPNGSLNGSFPHNGKATTRFGGGAFANAVGIDSQGRIVAAGGKGNKCCGIDYALARYTEDASPAGFAKIITPATRLVWIETPTNPLLQIVDIAAIADSTHRAGARSLPGYGSCR